jgi:hypothetical protein
MVRVKKQPANAPGKPRPSGRLLQKIDTHTSLKRFSIARIRIGPKRHSACAAQTTPAESAPETAQPRCLPASSRPQTGIDAAIGAQVQAVNVRMSSLTPW